MVVDQALESAQQHVWLSGLVKKMQDELVSENIGTSPSCQNLYAVSELQNNDGKSNAHTLTLNGRDDGPGWKI